MVTQLGKNCRRYQRVGVNGHLTQTVIFSLLTAKQLQKFKEARFRRGHGLAVYFLLKDLLQEPMKSHVNGKATPRSKCIQPRIHRYKWKRPLLRVAFSRIKNYC